MHTTKLEEIVRQKDPELKRVVELLAAGKTVEALANLASQGRVHEVASRDVRLKEIAKAYAAHPGRTLVVSPDNESRAALNAAIREELKSRGVVEKREQKVTVLVPRQELTGSDREWAAKYEPGDVLRYNRASRAVGVEAGEYAKVLGVDGDRNFLRVKRASGEMLVYDPRRLQGVTVYKEEHRALAVGDRIQFTAPYRDERITTRQLGTIERIDKARNIQLRMDSGRDVQFNAGQCPHLDYGFTMTSHSAQSATVERVILHVDATMASEELVNNRLAYVGLSRGVLGMDVYTDSASAMVKNLSREVSKSQALPEEQSFSVAV